MDMTEIMQFIINNGLAVVILIYFLKNNNQAMQELIKSNNKLIQSLTLMSEKNDKIYTIIDKCNKAS